MDSLVISDGVAMLIPRVFSSNTYLLHGSENIIIDPGCGDSNGLVKALSEFSVKASSVSRVYYTHMHFDHIGSGYLFPEAEHWMHEEDAVHVNNKNDDATYAYSAKDFKYPEITNFMKGGERIKVNDLKLEAFHAPGHTSGSTCFLERKEGLMFSGDVLFPKYNIGRWDLYSGNQEQQLKTVEEVRKLPWTTLLPGHEMLEKRELK